MSFQILQEKDNEKWSKNDLMGMSLTGLNFFIVGSNPWEHKLTIFSMLNKTLKIWSQQFNWRVTLTLINSNLYNFAVGASWFLKDLLILRWFGQCNVLFIIQFDGPVCWNTFSIPSLSTSFQTALAQAIFHSKS